MNADSPPSLGKEKRNGKKEDPFYRLPHSLFTFPLGFLILGGEAVLALGYFRVLAVWLGFGTMGEQPHACVKVIAGIY